MKNLLCRILAAACCMAVLASCKRDLVHQPPPSVGCQVRMIVMKTDIVKKRSGVFAYNHHGDPISYTPEGYGSGSVKYEFRYDDNRRLTDYIGYYANSATPYFEFWTKYIYDNNKVIRDTTYYYGRYGSEPTQYAKHKGYTVYEYDHKNRIGGIVYKELFNGVSNGVINDYRYVYNEQGNLVVPGAVYDNKISIYRTHNVWMFLNRNYSVNNIKSSTGYNSKGLPLGFDYDAPRGASIRFLEFLNLSNCEIVYDCK